jgi:hypothetical protein
MLLKERGAILRERDKRCRQRTHQKKNESDCHGSPPVRRYESTKRMKIPNSQQEIAKKESVNVQFPSGENWESGIEH